MLYIDTLPYIKLIKRKVSLPRNQKSMEKYNLLIANNDSYESVLNLYNHPMINTPMNYKVYYTDPIIKEHIGNKNVNINYRNDRKVLYNKIKEANPNLNPQNTLEIIALKNTIYDIHPRVNAYFKYSKKNISIKNKVASYINYIANIINSDKLSGYKYKYMMIDIEALETNKLTTQSKGINNPLLYIYYALYKDSSLLEPLGSIDIYFYSKEGIIRFNPSMINEDTFRVFKREMSKLLKKISLDEVEKDDGEIDNEDDSPDEPEEVKPTGSNLESQRAKDAKEEFKDNEVDMSELKTTDDEVNVSDEEPEDLSEEDEVPEDIDEIMSEELNDIIGSMTEITHASHRRNEVKSEASIRRNKELKEKQEKLVVKDNKTVKELTTFKAEDFIIPTNDVSDSVVTINENVKSVRYANFDKSYNENLMAKDTMSIITNLNNMSIPVYIKDIKVEDTSNDLNYKETYTIHLEDENRVRHTLKFDMPKFIDGSFMYIEGNKKIINKQMFMKPIVKTGPDEVQICSNYNKIFIYRMGRKMNNKLEKFKKVIATDIPGVKITYGDSLSSNALYKSILEYDELARIIYSIEMKDCTVIFNQADIHNRLKGKSIPDGSMCIGFYNDNTPILLDYKTETIKHMGNRTDDIITFIITHANATEAYDELSSGGNKFMYASAKVMNRYVPIVLFLGYCEGLTTVLRKAKIKHTFTDKRPQITDKQTYIQFADGYLVYDIYPFENSLLLNALAYMPTKAYNYADFDEIDVYIELFGSMYGARNLSNAFDTFYEFMIDPITKEVLHDLGYPTDFVSVMLCANAMLSDNTYISENNMNLYRIRSNEIVNAILYKEIANAYARYRATSTSKTPVKISIPQNAIISNLMKVQTVEDYSTLNPIYEATKTRIASPKGVSGMNLEQAYTLDKRSYSKTMSGLIGVSTSPDGNVGVTRHLTMEPNIVSARGYIDIKDVSELNDASLYTPAEMLTPMGISRDDAPRVAMASKQSTHIVPVKKSSPVIITNGAEQTIPYYLSSDFTIVAEEDGTIVERDDKVGLVIIKYKSGKTKAIDIHPRIAKNSASGFFVENKLICDKKVGDKVKTNEIVAYEERFFNKDDFSGTRMNIGSLQKVAIMSSYSTLDDSAFITSKLSKDMATTVVMMKDCVVGKNADVSKMVSVGDTVKVGDHLIEFSTSYDDKRMNELLRSIGEEQGEDIKNLSKVPIKTKYGGVIQDIKIYCSVELSELSPSLRTIVSAYYAKNNKKKKILDKYDKSSSVVKCGMLVNEPTSTIKPSEYGKIKGTDVDGVLIEFYIKYDDALGIGDKITYFSALKSVIGEVIPEGYEPYSEFRPDEEVSSFVGPLAILARMVPSTMQTITCNKVLIELKRKLEEIYNQ